MGLFDFFRRKKENPKEETESIIEIKDIETQRIGYLESVSYTHLTLPTKA